MGDKPGTDDLLRAALIVDAPAIPRWAVDAIALAAEHRRIEIVAVFLDATRSRRQPRSFLRAFRTVERRPYAHLLAPGAETIAFSPDALARAARLKLDVAISFIAGDISGLRSFPARHGVLSYSHLLSRSPLGFSELESDAPCVAVSVQRFSKKGDEVLAEGRFRIERHSWRATRESALSGSAFLLEKALVRCTAPPATRTAPPQETGPPPDRARIARLLAVLAARKLQRLVRGGFRRKAWRLLEADRPAVFAGEVTIASDVLPASGATQFLADPFYVDPEGHEIVCERMQEGTAFGDIVHLKSLDSGSKPLLGASRRHFSYPYVFPWEGRLYLLPEVADWSAPFLAELDAASGEVGAHAPLKGLENERLLDPTLIVRDGMFWLFASPARRFRQLDTLLLFVADRIEGPYRPHPMNPVVIDPASARPGGRLQEIDGQLLRFGQDNTRSYGAGLAVAMIETLTLERYCERLVGHIRLAGMEGPHTVDFTARRMIMDGYRNVIDPFAFAARLRPRPFRF